MSDYYAYEYETRQRARRLRREAEAERRACEVRAYRREQRRAAVTTAAHRVARMFEQLVGRRQLSRSSA